MKILEELGRLNEKASRLEAIARDILAILGPQYTPTAGISVTQVLDS